MSKPIIAVDIDDVLAQGTEALRIQVNSVTGADLLPEHYQVPGMYWGYYERVWQTHGLADKVSFLDLNKQMVEDQSHVPSVQDALRTLELLAVDYTFIVITARDESWRTATESWLAQNFPSIFESIHFAGSKTANVSKGALCKQLQVSWLIDDNVEHANTALDEGIKVILFGDYGWHKECVINGDVIRCETWQQIGEYFSEYN